MPNATERLEQLEEAVRVARRREEQVTADQRRAVRAVQAAEDNLARYFAALGAGEPADAAEEERLRSELRRAREAAEDVEWNARLEGAQQARQAAEEIRDEHGRENFSAIAAEQAALDPPAAERLQAAWAELQAAEAEYAARVRTWTRLVGYGGLTADDVPRLPTSGDPDTVRSRFARGVEVPTPRPLRQAPEEGQEAA